jgi:uncharacterized RDD family membrane protein YckC
VPQAEQHTPRAAPDTAAYPNTYAAAAPNLAVNLGALAGVGRRAVATILDFIVLFFTFVGMGGLVGAVGSETNASNVVVCGWLLLFLLYYPLTERYLSATIGKLALGLRVVKENGAPLGWQEALLRYVLVIVDAFPYVVPFLLGAIVIWTSPSKQRLGDRVANTLVVKRDALDTLRLAQEF